MSSQAFSFSILEKITENGKEIPIYDAKPFLVTKDEWPIIYRFPFDTLDSSPAAKKWSGCSYGRIEWNIEPRKIKYDRTEKRFYINQILVWAHQTRDKNYSGKIFGMNCKVESLGGGTRPLYDYEVYALNHLWRMTPSPVTKTMMMATYPPDGFDILEFNFSVSSSVDPMYQRFDTMPSDEIYYKQTQSLINKPKEYLS